MNSQISFMDVNLNAIEGLEKRISDTRSTYTSEREWMQTGDFGIPDDKSEHLNQFSNRDRFAVLDIYIEEIYEKLFPSLLKQLETYSKEFDYLHSYKEIDSPRELIKRVEVLIRDIENFYVLIKDLQDDPEIKVTLSGRTVVTKDSMDATTEMLFQFITGKEYVKGFTKPEKKDGEINEDDINSYDLHSDLFSLLKEVKLERKKFKEADLRTLEPETNYIGWIIAGGAALAGLAGMYFMSGDSLGGFLSNFGYYLQSTFSSIREFISTPQGKKSIFGGLGLGVISGLTANYWQNKVADKYPVLYADKERLTLKPGHDEIMVEYLAAVNNFCTTFSDAWNKARASGRNYSVFFSNLRDSATFAELKKYSDEAGNAGFTIKARLEAEDEHDGDHKAEDRETFYSYTDLASKVSEAATQMGNAWHYSYYQTYKWITVIETETYTEDGKVKTRPVTKQKQVVDRTYHTYDFTVKKALKAVSVLKEMLNDAEHLYQSNLEGLAVSVEAPNLETVKKNIDKKATKAEAKKYMNQWLFAAGIPNQIESIRATLDEVEAWLKDYNVKTFKPQYKDDTEGDSVGGWSPSEYKVSMSLIDTCNTVDYSASSITDNIYTALGSITYLMDNIVALESDEVAAKDKIKPGKRAKDAMKIVNNIYESTFPDSLLDYDLAVSNPLTAVIGTTAGLASSYLIYNSPSIMEGLKSLFR